MIPNQWYVVMDSEQVKDQPVGVTRMGEKLVFWRDDAGKVSCLCDKCVHRGVQLSKGKVINGHLQCPFHGFEYDTLGRVTLIPANGKSTPVPERFKVHGYLTYEDHGFIHLGTANRLPELHREPQRWPDSPGTKALPLVRTSQQCQGPHPGGHRHLCPQHGPLRAGGHHSRSIRHRRHLSQGRRGPGCP